MLEGIVIKSTGSWYTVKTDGGLIPCRIVGKFRLDGQKLTNPVAVGDRVEIILEEGEEKTGTIRKILPRDNYVLRQSPRKKHFMHLMAANIHQAFLVVTLRDPELKPGFIDRYLVMTEPYEIPVTILFNKTDLYEPEDWERHRELEKIYETIGYPVLAVSARSGKNIDTVRKLLEGKRTLVSGQSGVGKTTFLNALDPNLNLKEGTLSEYTGKGQHTTTFAEMYFMEPDIEIIDTPGIKTLAFNNLEVQDIAHNFKEFFQLSQHCRFNNCNHRDEPGCAVKEALENGEVSPVRYLNYLTIIDEIEDQNYWERHQDY